MTEFDIVIVGGGITGLAGAHRLSKAAPELKVLLLEASNRLGGKIKTERVGDFVLEAGADSFLSRKPQGIALCEEMGVADRLIGRLPLPHKNSHRAWVKRHGKLHPLPDGLTGLIPTNLDALQTTTLLSADGKLRIAEEPNTPRNQTDQDQSVGEFISGRLGREAYENIVEPLMSGIYAADGDQLSIQSTFPQLAQIVNKHGSLIGGLQSVRPPVAAGDEPPPFVSFDGGMEDLIDYLVDHAGSAEIRLNSPVTSIKKEKDRWELYATGEAVKTKALLLTMPAYVNANLLKEVAPQLSDTLAEIPFTGTVLVNVGINADDVELPEGYGYVIPRAEQRNVLACTWSSEKWPNRAPEGKRLVRVYIGRYGEDDVCSWPDHKLMNLARQELMDTLGLPANAKQLFMVHRWPKGLPQYTLGHQERLERIEQAIAEENGLAVAGASYRGVGIPDCIKSADIAVDQLLQNFK